MKKVVFILVANLLVLGSLFVIGEFAMRWAIEGGPGAALRSFFFSNEANGYRGTGGWLIYDADLGYKLNPGRQGVNSLDDPTNKSKTGILVA